MENSITGLILALRDATCIEELYKCVAGHGSSLVGDGKIFIGRLRPDKEKLEFIRGNGEAAVPPKALEALMYKSVHDRCEQYFFENAGAKKIEDQRITGITVPCTVGEMRLGAVAVQAPSDHPGLAVRELTSLQLLGALLGPFLYVIEQTTLIRKAQQKTKSAPLTSVNLVGNSEAMERVRDLVVKFAPAKMPVLIMGESGTGKELVARLIHEHSPRAAKPFVEINCASVASELAESEFLGYRKGAHTTATHDRKGAFEMAHGGTLFLDEIGELRPNHQSAILRAIQEGRFLPVGAENPVEVDVRIVAATNKDIPALVREGAFREDLYYRLAGLTIHVLPLKERMEDLPVLVDHLLKHVEKTENFGITDIEPEALEKLAEHNWPGNVRELQSCIMRAAILAASSGVRHIRTSDILIDAHGLGRPRTAAGFVGASIEEVERSHIEKVIQDSRGNISKASRTLGISRQTLYDKIKAYNIVV